MICPVRDKCKLGIKNMSCAKPHIKTEQCNMGCTSTPERTTCIPYKQRELQVGDRVRVTDKYDKTYMVKRMKGFLGKSLIIKSLYGKYVKLENCKGNSGFYWSWKPQDLELITEGDDMPKYRRSSGGRELTIWNFYNDGDGSCRGFCDELADLMHSTKHPTLSFKLDFPDLIKWAKQDSIRIKWLLEKGYIEEGPQISEHDKWVKACPSTAYKEEYDNVIEWAKRMPRE